MVLGPRSSVLGFILTFALIASSDEVSDSRRLSREAVKAYKAKNYALFLEKSRAASDLRPSHPTLLYNLAAGLALNGRGDEALDVLDRVAAMGMVYEPEKDSDFASLVSSSRFVRVVDAFKRNGAPTGKAKRSFQSDQRGLITEGLAYDPVTRRFFISSVRKGSILATRGRSPVVGDVPMGIFGMAVDAPRRRLWAAASALPQFERFRPENRDTAAVLEIDLRKGRLRRTFPPPDREKHLFGDVAVARDGTVYVSDSASPSIYRIRKGSMEPFIASPVFASLQGLALSSDGRLLYAADYSKGIFAIDIPSCDLRLLPIPRSVSLLGVDGLYAAGKGVLIGTQNGTNPQRVIRIVLARGGLAVDRVEVLAANEPDFDDITLGVVVGKSFYFNAAAQWNLFGDDGKQPDPSKLRSAIILRVKR